MSEAVITELVASRVLAQLAEFWADPAPGMFRDAAPTRIAGGSHDQPMPEGVSNPYWEIIRQLPLDTFWQRYNGRPEVDAYFFDPRDSRRLLTSRDVLCKTFSWSIPSPGDVAWITSRLQGRGVVEIGAGGGYWAWQLAQAGADVAAYDPAEPGGNSYTAGKPWYPVLRNDHRVVTKHPDRSLLLCWPSYDVDWAGKALALYRGDQLFYAGEGAGGCCAEDAFFNMLAAEWEDAGECPAHVSYSGIHCYLTEYRRKASAGKAAQ